MQVVVKLFAVARQRAGQPAITVELDEGADVQSLRSAMARQYPALAELTPHVVFAVNAQYARDDTRLRSDIELACIPPVSGG